MYVREWMIGQFLDLRSHTSELAMHGAAMYGLSAVTNEARNVCNKSDSI